MKLLALLLMLTLAPTAVVAQGMEVPTGSHVPRPKPADPDENKRGALEASRVLHDFARCVVLQSPERAHAFLALPYDVRETNRAAQRLATNDCLRWGNLRFSVSLFRGALYSQLYAHDFAVAAPVVGEAAEPMLITQGTERMEKGRAATVLFLREFADCVVRTDGAAVRQLLLSEFASKEEGEWFAALRPSLSACLPQEAKFRFTTIVLRGYLAEMAYRRAVQDSAGVQSASVGN